MSTLQSVVAITANIHTIHVRNGLFVFDDVVDGYSWDRVEEYENKIKATKSGIVEFKVLNPPVEFEEFHEAALRWFEFVDRRHAPLARGGVSLAKRWLETHYEDKFGREEIWDDWVSLKQRDFNMMAESLREMRAIIDLYEELPEEQRDLLDEHNCST